MLNIKFIDGRTNKMKAKLIWFLLLLSFPQHNYGQKSAYQFVFNLYSHYQNNKAGFSSLSPKAIDTIYAPELLNLIRLSEKQDQEGLGYDPVCDCQDDEGFKMNKIVVSTQNGITYARVYFNISDNVFDIRLKLMQTKTKWLIADIITARGSLYDFLKKNISK